MSSIGALICGRTLFDVTDGWNGRHTLDVPVVVVTHHVPADWVASHPDAPFTFVTDGIEVAVARARNWPATVTSPSAAGRSPGSATDLGLLDEVAVDLIPVVMGEGSRPFFGKLSSQDVMLGNPTVCSQGDRVTHLISSHPLSPGSVGRGCRTAEHSWYVV